MKMNMVQELEGLINWLETGFVDYYMKESASPREMWEVMLKMHLETANKALILAKIAEDGSIETESVRYEAQQRSEELFGIFFEVFPDEAFVGVMS